MTSYTLLINGSSREFLSLAFTKNLSSDPDTWEGILASKNESVDMEHSLEIKRDGTSIFKGIVEIIENIMDSQGVVKKIGGRQTAVKVWRSWGERYISPSGFWKDYYPNKIVEFLSHSSKSDDPKDDPDNYYLAMGWGLDPTDWTVTASGTESEHTTKAVTNRLLTIGWRLDTNQANNEYIKIDLGSVKSICGIRITNETLEREEFVRNYKIEISTDDVSYSQKATKTNNRAINIVESWTPANARYIKVTCTASFADRWRISDIYVFTCSIRVFYCTN